MKLVLESVAITILLALSHLCTVVNASKSFNNHHDLKEEVDNYCSNPTSYDESDYGPIEEWDVSRITNMESLFFHKDTCNPNISAWDVSAVTSFALMFGLAISFNQDIGGWDVSSSTDFGSMFLGAELFNQDIGGWDVSSGTDFDEMFGHATSFNQNIGGWDVSSGTDFYYMFKDATSFNQNVGGWDVSSGIVFVDMFGGATAFNQNLARWPLHAHRSYGFCSGAICGNASSKARSTSSLAPNELSTSANLFNGIFIGLVLSSFIVFSVYFYKRRRFGKRNIDSATRDEGIQLPMIISATKSRHDYDYIPLQENRT